MYDLISLGEKARKAKYDAAVIPTDKKNEVLLKCAEALKANEGDIIKANAIDLENAVANGMSAAMQDRLKLTPERIDGINEGLRQVSELPDPVGEIMDEWDRPNGLHITKVRVPMGVIGIIYESRPNVTPDAFLPLRPAVPAFLRAAATASNPIKPSLRFSGKCWKMRDSTPISFSSSNRPTGLLRPSS